MDIHILRQQGLSIRKIAALRQISRNAVRRALRSPAPPTGKRQRAKGVKLEPFKGLIDGWLRDEVTSQWTAERIFDELHDRGYDGGRTVIKEYVHEHRPRPAPMAEARFHVKPGQQVQVDWAEMGLVSSRRGAAQAVRVRRDYGVVASAVRSVHDRHEVVDLARLPPTSLRVLRWRSAGGADRQPQDRRRFACRRNGTLAPSI